MVWRRIIYAILLIAAVAAFIITDSSISLFLCVCLLALPPVSFIMLLFAAKKLRFDYEIRESCIRGGALHLTLKAGLRPRFLAGCVKVIVEIRNTTFHKCESKAFLFSDLSFTPHIFDYVSNDSGRISLKFKAIKLIDILGICSYTVKRTGFAESFVAPVLYDDIPLSLGYNSRSSFSGEISLPQKGNDHSEIFDIRDYVPGDSLNSIHWKLSGKFETLKTKEYGSTEDRNTVILVDFSRRKYDKPATDEQLNAVLDAVVSVSQSLETKGYQHSVCWFDNGEASCSSVTDNDSFVRMVNSLMSIKVSEENAQTMFYFMRAPECSAFTHVIFITTAAAIEELRIGSDLAITVIAVGDGEGEVDDGNIRIINVSSERLGSELALNIL